MKTYAGIGARKTPNDALSTMGTIGKTLALEGWTLRSGHADGADDAFLRGCLSGKGTKEIYLPWDNFNCGRNSDPGYQAIDVLPNFNEAMDIAEKFHPNWKACSAGAKKLHTRNVYQIVGMDLQTPVNMVICWTPEGKRSGGTGQALRIAEFLEISIFDLALEETMNKLLAFVN